MMEMVGHPVAVNPDGPLENVATQRGWPIVIFSRRTKQVVKTTTALGGAAGWRARPTPSDAATAGSTRRRRAAGGCCPGGEPMSRPSLRAQRPPRRPVAEVERLAALVRAGRPGRGERLAADRRDRAIRASLVLDGVPRSRRCRTCAPRRLVAARTHGTPRTPPPARRRAGSTTLHVLDDPDDELVRRSRSSGSPPALAADDLTTGWSPTSCRRSRSCTTG
jgi:hypothetical protein